MGMNYSPACNPYPTGIKLLNSHYSITITMTDVLMIYVLSFHQFRNSTAWTRHAVLTVEKRPPFPLCSFEKKQLPLRELLLQKCYFVDPPRKNASLTIRILVTLSSESTDIYPTRPHNILCLPHFPTQKTSTLSGHWSCIRWTNSNKKTPISHNLYPE